MYKMQKFVVRRWLLDEGKRVDGRGINEIRPLAAEVGLLPRVHGSGMFTRGQTQVLTGCHPVRPAATRRSWTTSVHWSRRSGICTTTISRPIPWARPVRPAAPAAARSATALWPSAPCCPCCPLLRSSRTPSAAVSEVLSSNGSTSQASICGSTLALMDAGVPIKAPVAGISCGLITEGDRWMTMLDIQGVEDFHGDMDFKVGGTRNGITAIQMDIKVDGLTYEIIEEAFEKCRKARLYILDEIMAPVIAEPRAELSKYAPKMLYHEDRRG